MSTASAEAMGKSRRQKSGSQWSSRCEKEKKKNLGVDNAADNTIKKSDVEVSLFCHERAVVSSNAAAENVDGSSSRSGKTSEVIRGSRRVKRLSSAKRVLKPWPSRNIESAVCDRKLIYVCKPSKGCRKIRNELQKSHRCFDFALRSTIQTCCLATTRESWSLVNRWNLSKRGKSASLQTKDHWKLSSTALSSSSDIPGFYFDPEKKSYFRIVPSCKNVMSNAVTSERLKHENQEQVRLKELQSLRSTGKLIYPEHQTTIMTMPNILTIVEKSKIANKQPYSRMHEIQRACIAKMSEYVGWRMKRHSIIRKICLNPSESKLSVLSEVKEDSHVAIVSTANLLNAMREPHSKYDVIRDEICLGFRRPVDMCFLAVPDSSRLILCTYEGVIGMHDHTIGYCNSSVVIKKLPLCCSSGLAATAFGTESSVVVLEHVMEGRREKHKEFNTSHSAVHSVAFASTNPHLFFCGAKDRRILLFDRRATGREPVSYLTKQTGYSGDLYMTKDDRYLLSSDMNSPQIERWDLRQGRVVMEYPGHVNHYQRTPIVVDRNEEFFSAVGTNGYTRIWDLRSGELLKVLPPPLPTTCESLPTVCFLSCSSRSGRPGLLMGICDEIKFFYF